MKCFLIAVYLMIALMGEAQILNIPDSNFKRCLVNQGIDLNADGEIQETEAATVTQLTIYEDLTYSANYPVTNTTGLKEFKNLETLAYYTRSPTMDISGLIKLKSVTFSSSSNSIGYTTSINALNCTSLELFSSVGSGLASLTNLNLNGCGKLKKLILRNNAIDSFNPGILDSLYYVDLLYGSNSTIDLTGCKNLKTFYCFDNQVANINLSGLNKMDTMVTYNLNHLQKLNLNGCSAITGYSNYSSPELRELDVSGCISLKNLYLHDTKITSLDLGSLTKLDIFHFSGPNGVSTLKYLNLKNGSFLPRILTIVVADSAYICADEFQVEVLKSIVNIWGENVPRATTAFVVSSYCSFFPGGNYNTISGKIRLDLNNNGCDNTDRNIPNVALRIADTSGNALIRYTATSGDYAHYPYKGIFTLTPYFPYPYFTISPSSTTVVFDTANSLQNTSNFCIQPNGIHNDLEISFLPTFPAARPGFNADYTLVYKNHGTTTLSGSVQANFDNSKMNFVSASTVVATQSTGLLSWNYNNLLPFESRTINVTFNLQPPPVNNIGDTLIYLATISPSANDETTFDNSFILPQRVKGSFDPNEKQCLGGSKLDISKIGEYLHYQIHFQNEGTDTAFNIVVADTLSDKLDWNTLELISSSHPADVRSNKNKAEFIFANIRLPYKAINEPASNGWVAFKIKPKPSVIIGDSLKNKAAIYFDFNMPVITNTATTIVTAGSVPLPVKLDYFAGSSNGSSSTLKWKASCTNGTAAFAIERSSDGYHFKTVGNVNATALRCRLPFDFTDQPIPGGKNFYRLKITDVDGFMFYSKIVVMGNNRAGFDITAIGAQNAVSVYFSSPVQQNIKMQIVGADGKLVYITNKNIAPGAGKFDLPIKNLAAGVYTLVVYSNEGLITKRFFR